MYHTILIATDLDTPSYDILQKAMALARQLQATVYLLHIIEPPASTVYAASLGFAEYTDPVPDDAIIVMKTLGEEFNIPTQRQLVRIGNIKTLIHDIAQQLTAQLIIIGSHHTPQAFSELLGTTADGIVQRALCDVLVMR